MIGEHRDAIELFSTAVQRGNSDPRYKWSALLAFSHYLLKQYDASLSWAREAYVFEFEPSSNARGARGGPCAIGRTEEAAEAADVLLGSYPRLTVERHLRNSVGKTWLTSIITAKDFCEPAYLNQIDPRRTFVEA